MSKDFRACAICAHDIYGPKCPHPWNLPFARWPHDMLQRLKEMVRQP